MKTNWFIYLYCSITVIILFLFNLTTKANTNRDTSKQSVYLFIGTYTNGASKGIYMYKMNTLTGKLNEVCYSSNTSNPSYLVVHPGKNILYSVNEIDSGSISSFSFDLERKMIKPINTVSSEGSAPCYVSIDNTGKFLMTANYTSGDIALLPIEQNGSLKKATFTDRHRGNGPVVSRQEGPHAHMITQAKNSFVYYTDLGLDKIFVYKLNTSNSKLELTKNSITTEPGMGPRHIAFHPTQSYAYCLGELNGTIECFSVNESNGVHSRFQIISTMAPNANGSPASADIHITPDGKYLYASNRGDNNNIAMYSIDQKNGKLSLTGHQSTLGLTPRNFEIDPSGKFLLAANQNSNTIIVFKIDPKNGKLTDIGEKINIPSPVCIKFI